MKIGGAEISRRRRRRSTIRLQEPLDDLAEIRIVFREPLDLFDRVHHRRVVLVVEQTADFRIGKTGQFPAEIHRDLSRKRDRLGVRLRLHVGDAQPVVRGDRLDDLRGDRTRLFGADDVFLAPTDEQGLRDALAPYTQGRGADAVIITVPGERPFPQAVAGVRRGGLINIFAAHAGVVPLNLETFYQRELSIISTYSSSPDELRIALDLLTSRKVRVDRLISHRLPLAQFLEGVSLMQKRAALKVYFAIAGEA